MAISATHYHLLKKLRDDGVLPQGGRILEIGQANWYGDMDPNDLVEEHLAEGDLDWNDIRHEAGARLCWAVENKDAMEIVRALYALIMRTPDRNVNSIDLDPAAKNALRLDLNELPELPLRGCFELTTNKYDLTINHGTAEHIFNIANVFRLMHDATKPGGLMIHESPFTGWVDHGFYNLQPTLFWDVARTNAYEVVMFATEHLASQTAQLYDSREQILDLKRRGQLADNLMLFVVLRKTTDEPFKIPTQGIYSEAGISAQAAQAWRELR